MANEHVRHLLKGSSGNLSRKLRPRPSARRECHPHPRSQKKKPRTAADRTLLAALPAEGAIPQSVTAAFIHSPPLMGSTWLAGSGGYEPLLQAGVRIFEYRTTIHAKTFVVDSEWSAVTKMNFDNRSLAYNNEVGRRRRLLSNWRR